MKIKKNFYVFAHKWRMLRMMAFMALMVLPLAVFADTATALVNQINQIPGLAASAEGNLVKVTGRTTGAVSTQLTLNMDADVTVEWGAVYQGSVAAGSGTALSLIRLTGDGAFVVVSGGLLENTNSGTTINAVAENPSILVHNGSVIAYTGTAIRMTGQNATVVVSGSSSVTTHSTVNAQLAISMTSTNNTGLNVTVKDDAKVAALANDGNGYAIQTYGNVQISGNAEVYALGAGGLGNSGTGCAINALGANSGVSVSGGKVWSNIGIAIHTNNAGASVIISGGEVYSAIERTDRAVIYMEGGGAVTVNGTGKVKATGGSVAIRTSSSMVEIAGNTQVSATTGYAIATTGTGSAIQAQSGFVFAYGTGISGGTGANNVVNTNPSLSVTDNGMVVAWNYNGWNTNGQLPYYAGTSDHLLISSADDQATAVWGKNGSEYGIFYQNGENTGFFPLFVTVIDDDTDEPVKAAVINDVTVSGEAGEELPGVQTATITLTGDTFAEDGFSENAAGWFTSDLPPGVTVTANKADDVTVILTFTGTPTEASNAVFAIEIPVDVLTGGTSLIVTSNPDAKFDINAPQDDDPGNDDPGNDNPMGDDPGNNDPKSTSSHTVNVIQGTGSGEYETGDIITIVANTAAVRQRFVRWEITPSVIFTEGTDLNSPKAHFIMPVANVTATAIYEYIPAIEYPIIVLNDGNGTASASEDLAPVGAIITLTAVASDGYRFREWIVIKGHIILSDAKDNPAQFRVRDYGVEVKAIFEAVPKDFDVATDVLPQVNTLKAYVHNGTLHVSGLTAGAIWRVYSVAGTLIYESIPNSSNGGISSPFGGVGGSLLLPERGVYIVTDGIKTVKVAN